MIELFFNDSIVHEKSVPTLLEAVPKPIVDGVKYNRSQIAVK